MAEQQWNGELAQKVGGWLAAAISAAWGVKKHREARAIDVQDRIDALENFRRELERWRSEIHRFQQGMIDRMDAVDIRQDRIERKADEDSELLRRIERRLEKMLAELIRRVPDPTTEQRRPDAPPPR